MSLKIGTNVAALTAYQNLNKGNAAVATAMQRLSSGNRINSVADDAGG